MGNEVKVLFIDDEEHNRTSFTAAFRKHFQVFTASSADEGKVVLSQNEIHVIITDQYLNGTSGVEFLQSVMVEYPDPVRVLLTGRTVIEDIIEAINKTHIYAYINKPWEESELLDVVQEAYKTYTRRKEQKNLIVNLMRTNEQLEFMLREKLVS